MQLGSQCVAFACTKANVTRWSGPSIFITILVTANSKRTPGQILEKNTNAGTQTTEARATSGGVQRSLKLALLRDEELAHLRGHSELLVAFGFAG